MSLLEEKIRKNRDSLDAAEPTPGHQERFEKKLASLPGAQDPGRLPRVSRVWKVAAVILILAGLSVTLYLTSPGRFTNNLSATPLPAEIQEVKMFYESEAQKKLDQMQQCAVSPDQADLIRQIAQQELVALDSNSEELENQLINDQGNKQIQDALILNYKTKADLIEDIIKKVCKL
jgi:hypothetical protein